MLLLTGRMSGHELSACWRTQAAKQGEGLPKKALDKVDVAISAIEKLSKQAGGLLQELRSYQGTPAAKACFKELSSLRQKINDQGRTLEDVAILGTMPDGRSADCTMVLIRKTDYLHQYVCIYIYTYIYVCMNTYLYILLQ